MAFIMGFAQIKTEREIVMDINFDEQFARMEMDMAWDKYLDNCQLANVPPMSFAQWKRDYIQ